jgi:hypothetical protein
MGWPLLCVLLVWRFASTGSAVSDVGPNFHFHCDAGYAASECEAQLGRLRDVLAPLELTRLGEWTWILVRSDDWKPILRRVGRDPDSPAFTVLEKRETFLEEALFRFDPVRSRTLIEKWRTPLDQLLLLAVSHELGHALCHETDEPRTNEYAAQLRSTGRTMCHSTRVSPGRIESSSAYARAVHNAMERLPKRSPVVSVIDADEARPDLRESMLKLDAFVTMGGKVVYVVKQSAVLEAAARGSTLHECMLASIIWHEMAHIDGADERGARRAEEQLWTQFVRDEAVDVVTGLRYLQALTSRPDDRLAALR